MLIWLGGLVWGAWWIWPHVERMAPTRDLAVSILWLLSGTGAWLVALGLGWQRYFRR